MELPDSQRHPKKRCQIKYEKDANVYNYEKRLFTIAMSIEK